MRIGTILHIVLKFQVDRACFHGREVDTYFGLNNVLSAFPNADTMTTKSSSGDEIANVNCFTMTSYTYYKVQ